MGPGQTSRVAVELVVPNGISDTVNTVILTAQVFGFSGFDIVEKSAFLYVQNTNSRVSKVFKTRMKFKKYNKSFLPKSDQKMNENSSFINNCE